LDYQVDELRDDATMMLVEWAGTNHSPDSDIPVQRPEMANN
jgi:hypothetical protein